MGVVVQVLVVMYRRWSISSMRSIKGEVFSTIDDVISEHAVRFDMWKILCGRRIGGRNVKFVVKYSG